MKKINNYYTIAALYISIQTASALNVEKLQLSDCILINATSNTQKVTVASSRQCHVCSDCSTKKQPLTLLSNEKVVVTNDDAVIQAIQIKDSSLSLSAQKVVLPHDQDKTRYQLTIEPKNRQAQLPLDFEKAVPKCTTYPHPDMSSYHTLKGLPAGISFEDAYLAFKSIYESKAHLLARNHDTKKNKIPHHLHQVWVGSPLPVKYKKWQKEWRKKHPNWRYTCWTEELLHKNFPDGLYNQQVIERVKQTTSRYRFAEMADIIRYEVLNNYGGTYLDTDSKNFEHLGKLHNNYDFYAGLEPHDFPSYVGNSIIGSTANSAILKKCIELISKGWEVVSNNIEIGPVERTGPALLTHAILSTPLHTAYESCCIFPSHYFYINNQQRSDDAQEENVAFNGLLSSLSCHCFDGHGLG